MMSCCLERFLIGLHVMHLPLGYDPTITSLHRIQASPSRSWVTLSLRIQHDALIFPKVCSSEPTACDPWRTLDFRHKLDFAELTEVQGPSWATQDP